MHELWGKMHSEMPSVRLRRMLVCVTSSGFLTCEICEHKAELSGSWVDGTKLVDDSLSENFHKMGSFLISKIDGVRLAANPRSEEAHDILEFRGLVRG